MTYQSLAYPYLASSVRTNVSRSCSLLHGAVSDLLIVSLDMKQSTPCTWPSAGHCLEESMVAVAEIAMLHAHTTQPDLPELLTECPAYIEHSYPLKGVR